ncbi:hypothetical protein BKA69DRAFT_1123546 [Paraphysoderma sedebokerense]|nr:hypothetical protein BKA69DRAFT_1123546 [Paraphysoderma sedebokerense]
MPQPRASRLSICLLILTLILIIYLTADSSNDDELNAALDLQKKELDVLKRLSWEVVAAGRNQSRSTNETIENDDLWKSKEMQNSMRWRDFASPIRGLIDSLYNHLPVTTSNDVAEGLAILPHFYHNVSGTFKGQLNYYDLLVLNDTTFLPVPLQNSVQLNSLNSSDNSNHLNHTNSTETLLFNATRIKELRGTFPFDKTSTMRVVLIEKEMEDFNNMTLVDAHLKIKCEENEASDIQLSAFGVHIPKNGSFWMFGREITHHVNLIQLPVSMKTDELFNQTKVASIEKYEKRIEKLKKFIDGKEEYTDETPESTNTNCSFYVFGQLGAIYGIRLTDLLEFENELRNPTFIPTIRQPPLNFSIMLYSPDCHIIFSTSNLTISSNISNPTYPHTTPLTGTFFENENTKLLHLAIVLLVVGVFKLFTIIKQMDATITESALSRVSPWFIGVQAMMDAWFCLVELTTAVVLDDMFEIFAAVGFVEFITFTIFELRWFLKSLKAQREPTRILGNIERSPISFHIRLSFAHSPALLTVLLLIANSYPSLQSIHTVRSLSTSPLPLHLCFLSTVSRLTLPLYILMCPENIVTDNINTQGGVLILVWIAIQFCWMILQKWKGPEIGVPKKWRRQRFEYVRARTKEEEMNLLGYDPGSIESWKAEDPEKGGRREGVECVICMSPIEELAGAVKIWDKVMV